MGSPGETDHSSFSLRRGVWESDDGEDKRPTREVCKYIGG